MPRDWPRHSIPHYPRAVFLDRDGTINVDHGYTHKPQDLRLFRGVIPGLRILAALPLQLIVVSNQAGIALGIHSKDDMSAFNATLQSRLERRGAHIDAFYYCPHLNRQHVPVGTALCECAKPKPGMLIEAARDYNLEMSQSYMIGDKSTDILAGKSAGCVSILVQTGEAGNEKRAVPITPDFVVRDLYHAAQLIQKLVMAI